MNFNYKEIHIGTLIKQLVLEKEVDNDRIANFLKVDKAVIEEMYVEKSLDTNLLLRWSKLLEYDFFRIYSQHLLLYAPMPKKKNKVKSALPSFTKSLYTPEIIGFIIELIELKKKTPTEIIKEYNIPKTTLYKWIKKHKK